MINPITFRASVEYNKEVEQNLINESPNPLRLQANLSSLSALSNYNQVLVKPKYDKDSLEILTKIDALTKLMPNKLELPHSIKAEDINGERVYDKNGSLMYIREYGNDMIRDYYPSKDAEIIKQIIERDKNTGAVVSKIEPVLKDGGSLKVNITVFDEKINNKYTMFQVEEDGAVSSITEFSGKGKGFRTLFRNPDTTLPVRYIEAKEDENNEFEFIDCRLNSKGEVSEIKKISSSKQVNIQYNGSKKIIDVKQGFDI